MNGSYITSTMSNLRLPLPLPRHRSSRPPPRKSQTGFPFAIAMGSTAFFRNADAAPGPTGAPAGGIHVAGQLLIALILLLVGIVVWRGIKSAVRKSLLTHFGAYVVAGMFLALIVGLLYLASTVFMAGGISFLVIPGMIAGIICIAFVVLMLRG